jgi:DNA-binding CsgD family transcriptional regulator
LHISDRTISELGACAGLIGHPDFYRRLRDAAGSMLRWDMCMVMRYSSNAVPEYVISDDVPSDQIDLYLSGYYRLDPFFEYWRTRAQAGVMRMRETKAARHKTTAYFQVFQPQTGMCDGLAIFLPSRGGSAMAICFERSVPFTTSEVRRSQAILPLLVGLNAAHDYGIAPKGKRVILDRSTALPPIDLKQISEEFLEGELTPRERQIVELIIDGRSSYEIGGALSISEGTVKNHRKRLYKKLNIVSERDLLARFIQYLAMALPHGPKKDP